MMVGADIKRSEGRRGPQDRRSRASSSTISASSRTIRTACGSSNISLELKGGEILGHRRRRRQRTGRAFRGPVRRAAGAGSRHGGDRRHRRRPSFDHRSGASCGAAFVPEERLGHGTAPRHEAFRERASDRPRRQRDGQPRFRQHAPRTLSTVDRATETFDVRKAKRDPEAASLSGGNLQKFIVGREILRDPAVLVVSQPTWGVDAGAAAVIRQALIDLAARRRRRAGDQPGPRRTGRDHRPHRGHVPRPSVGADGDRRRQPRDRSDC